MGRRIPGNKMIGAISLDRLRDGAHKIVLDGEIYRGPKPDAETLRIPARKKRQKSSNLDRARILELLANSGAVTAKMPGAITLKGDNRSQWTLPP
jgi:hypothetical protein